MCELILTSLIVGFVNVGPNHYVVQAQDMEGNIVECEVVVTPKENEINF